LKRARDVGVATARLPIRRHVQLASSVVLTVNHVVQARARAVPGPLCSVAGLLSKVLIVCTCYSAYATQDRCGCQGVRFLTVVL
jgi:hypothetical protein